MNDVSRTFQTLRTVLEEMGVKTQNSAGRNAYFTAYTERDLCGNPANGVFVHGHAGRRMFIWPVFNRHPMDDIAGAAQRIRESVAAQSTLSRYNDGSEG